MAHKLDWNPERVQGSFWNLFVHAEHCQQVSSEKHQYWKQCVQNETWAGINRKGPDIQRGCGMIPSDEMLDFFVNSNIRFSIESMWFDGCSLYVYGDKTRAQALLKLRFPDIVRPGETLM